MTKKIISLLLAAAMAASLFACKPASGGKEPDTTPSDSASPSATDSDGETHATESEDGDSDTGDGGSTDNAGGDSDASGNGKDHKTTYTGVRTYTSTDGMVLAQVIVEVENTGDSSLHLAGGKYSLKDEKGEDVKSGSLETAYPEVISPGEKGYFYEEIKLEDMSQPPKLELTSEYNVEETKDDRVTLKVTESELSDTEQGGILLKGRLDNSTSEEQSLVYITTVLYDEADNPTGAFFSILVNRIEPGGTATFESFSETLPEQLKADDVARYEVYAYPM